MKTTIFNLAALMLIVTTHAFSDHVGCRRLYRMKGSLAKSSRPQFDCVMNIALASRSKSIEEPQSLVAEEEESPFMLRSAQYGDLAQVTEILIDSFYTPTSFTRPYLYLSELSRLQNNFPYSDERHSFFVAVGSIDDEDQIVGFVGENLMLIILFG